MISGITITFGTDIILNSISGTGKTISAVVLNENSINVLYESSNHLLYSMLCEISGTTITRKNNVSVSLTVNSGTTISAVALNEKDIFIAHSGGANYYLYATVVSYLENLVKTITSSTEKISGIAITDGQAGEIVQVKKPDETFMCSFNASVTAEGKSITWNNAILTHRKVLDGGTKVFSPAKSIEIGGIVYEFKFFIRYKEDTAAAWTGWKIGWEFSPKLYSPSATASQNTEMYASPIQKQTTRSSKFYTEQLSGGVEITLTETETPIFD